MKPSDSHRSAGRKAPRPIENPVDLTRIRDHLASKPRDLLLFELAVGTGLVMNLLLGLRVRDVKDLPIGESIAVSSAATGRAGLLTMAVEIRKALDAYLESFSPGGDDFLFKSRKGGGPLNLSSVSHLIRSWFKAVGLDQPGGAVALRKTHQVHFNDRFSEPVRTIVAPKSTEPFEPIVEPPTVQEIVYRKLFQAIVSGRIPPGERLIIERLARQMSVSRMPVREALHRLQAIGLVDSVIKKGLVVAQLSREDYLGLTEVRLLLEVRASELAAELRTENEVELLTEYYRQFVRSGRRFDVDEFLKYNRLFHHAVYRAARQPILHQVIESLWDRVSPYLYLLVDSKDYDSTVYHAGVLKAVVAGDPDEAGRCMRLDIEEGSKVIAAYFDRN